MESANEQQPDHLKTLIELLRDRGCHVSKSKARLLSKDKVNVLIKDILIIKNLHVKATKPNIKNMLASAVREYPGLFPVLDSETKGNEIKFNIPTRERSIFVLMVLRRITSSQAAASGELTSLCGENNFQILVTETIAYRPQSKPNTKSRVRALRYVDISYNPTRSDIVPNYTKLSDDQVNELLSSMRIQRNQLPRILTSDPIVKYYNFLPGDILRIESKIRDHIYYRIVHRDRDLVI